MTELEKSAYILVRRGVARTRAELARRLEVSRPTASTAAERLLSAGLIMECGKGKSTGGTAPILLSARKDVPGFVGVDLGYTDRMSGVLLDGAGGIAAKAERTFDPADPQSIAENTKKLVDSLCPEKNVPGAAVALSAIIDEKSGRIISSVNPVFRDGKIKKLLEKELSCPVFTANRSRAAAISEAFGGAADSEENFSLISLGKSVGAAFWCGGRLFCGAYSAAGEIRDLRLASGMRLEEALSPEKTAGADREDIMEICADALSQLIDIMDLRLLILSGRFADFGGDFSSGLEEKLNEKTGGVRVRSARFGRYSAARGSAFRMGELFIPCP
ncbi:MAG: ROK family transcriptional regulator [Lentisphaeria bacterium]|nr:ROK family transcriptional regulator [Lentisphaeria bacterium]